MWCSDAFAAHRRCPGRPRVLWDCGQRCHVAGTDVGEVAEVDGGDRGNREPLAYRDHRCVGPAQVPVGVASYEFGHAADIYVGQAGQLEGVGVAGAHAVQEGGCAAGPIR
jgi:hypothetical protein